MAPKAKGAAKAKAKVVAKAKARLRVRGRGNMARPAALMRRPAGAEEAPGEDSPERVWERGAAVPLAQLPLHLIRAAKRIVTEEGSYFNAECKFAGMVEGIDFLGDDLYLRMELQGTLNEALLKFQPVSPSSSSRCIAATRHATKRRLETPCCT
jgi:hypothetical protein